MSMFGGGFGGFNAGGRPTVGAAGRSGNGLPFAGIPADLAEGVARLEALSSLTVTAAFHIHAYRRTDA